MKQFLSITELAAATGLEESLIRFYESEYAGQLPEKILRGNSLFFHPQAIAAFQNVHARHGERSGSGDGAVVERHGYARVIAVSSGKGGVGKSNLALNLAIEFQRLGKMALVLDADLGMANIHLLAGIQPRYTLKDLIDTQLPVSDLIADGPAGVGIIPGGAGILALADSTASERRRMLSAMEVMEQNAQVIVVDTAAGMGVGVRDFLKAADEIILVLTQDLTSLADAYGLLKALQQEGLSRPVYSVVNMAISLKQAAGVAVRFANCASQFLGLQVQNVGYVMRDSSVGAATARRTPLNVFAPNAKASKNIHNIAVALLRTGDEKIKMNSAFQRYMNLLKEKEGSEKVAMKG